jgi:hypothetical protein
MIPKTQVLLFGLITFLSINEKTYSQYYICGGNYAECYHTKSSCRGLNNCRSSIYSVSSISGYLPCSICAGHIETYPNHYYISPSSTHQTPEISNKTSYLPLSDMKLLKFHNSESKTLTVPQGKYWWACITCGREGGVNQIFEKLKDANENLIAMMGYENFKSYFNSTYVESTYKDQCNFWVYKSGEKIKMYNGRTNYEDKSVGNCMIDFFEFEGSPKIEYLDIGRVVFSTKLINTGNINVSIEGKHLLTITEKYSGSFEEIYCGDKGTFNKILKNGNYNYFATAANGQKWSGYFTINDKDCTIVELK